MYRTNVFLQSLAFQLLLTLSYLKASPSGKIKMGRAEIIRGISEVERMIPKTQTYLENET